LLRHICTERCFFQAEDGIRDVAMTRVQTCALPIYPTPPLFQYPQSQIHQPQSMHTNSNTNTPMQLHNNSNSTSPTLAPEMSLGVSKDLVGLGIGVGSGNGNLSSKGGI